MLSEDRPHVFVVASGLDVASNAGECFLTEGDVLKLAGSVLVGEAAKLKVLASKGQDCPKNSTVEVEVSELQEMQNHLLETLDQGLGELQQKQGHGGIPLAPPTAPQQSALAAAAPPPDSNVKSELAQQSQEADQAEQQLLREASASGPAQADRASNKTIVRGQTIADVVAIMGDPEGIANIDGKTIYRYDRKKLTFVDGKLAEIR